METRPDTIKVNASQREEIEAAFADLMVTVKGSSLISGDAALKKAKEVSQLVDELTRFGLPAEAIHLQSVYAETSNGMLRSSSAIYRLRLRCEKLEQFADLLGIIANQKSTTLERIDWKYPDETAQEAGLEKALNKANAKACKIATALGVKLLGVYSLSENTYDQEAPVPQRMFAAPPQARSMGVASSQAADLGMDIQHSKVVEVRVEIEYRVSGFEQS